jgi:hypothetical protein
VQGKGFLDNRYAAKTAGKFDEGKTRLNPPSTSQALPNHAIGFKSLALAREF